MIDVLLVNPDCRKRMYGSLADRLGAIEPPLYCALLGAFVRQRGLAVRILDAGAEGLSVEETVEAIVHAGAQLTVIAAVGANPSASSTPKMQAIHEILEQLNDREAGITTLLFGIHPSALPEETLQAEKANYVCRGEPFYTVLELARCLLDGRRADAEKIPGLCYRIDGQIVCNGWSVLIDPDELPLPAWDLLPMHAYRAHNWHCFGRLDRRSPYGVLYTSLGCPYQCSYCNIHVLYNGQRGIRYRRTDSVIDEIDRMVNTYGISNIKIADELFVLNRDRLNRFCDSMIERGYDLNFWVYARVDTVNLELLEKMRRAGIRWIAYGIESVDRQVRQSVGKAHYSLDQISRVIDQTHQAGIHVVANLIFGLPEDTIDSMTQTLDFLLDHTCEYGNFYCAMAYPGSELYRQYRKTGVDLPESYLAYSQFSRHTVPLSTRHLTAAQVLDFRDRAFETYHSSAPYERLIRDRFGPETLDHIRQMLSIKLKRDLISRSSITYDNQ